MLTLAPQRSDNYSSPAIGSLSKHEFRAPQICAFFSTIFSEFSETDNALNLHISSAIKEASMSSTRPRYSLRPESISDARYYVMQVKQFTKETTVRSYIYQRYKPLFWYLSIFDKEWFESNYPPGKRGATFSLPSIEADRVTILKAMAEAPVNRVRVWMNRCQQEFFRASLRDSDWLAERKQDTAKQSRREKAEKKQRFFENCLDEIKSAAKRISNPHNMSSTEIFMEIAPHTNMNEDQLRHFFAKHANAIKKLFD